MIISAKTKYIIIYLSVCNFDDLKTEMCVSNVFPVS